MAQKWRVACIFDNYDNKILKNIMFYMFDKKCLV